MDYKQKMEILGAYVNAVGMKGDMHGYIEQLEGLTKEVDKIFEQMQDYIVSKERIINPLSPELVLKMGCIYRKFINE